MELYHHQNLPIKNWAEEDRPREKLLLKGRSNLTEAELIGILIGSGTKTMSAVDLSKQILASVNNNLNELAQLSVKGLMKFKGIGEAKAITIVSALELGRRRKSEDLGGSKKLISSKQVYELVSQDLSDLKHEEFWIVLLKRNSELIKKIRISAGGVAGTVADTKIIFNHALTELASSVILVHNHPSGELKPSSQDINFTKRTVEAGKLLDIQVIDHLIYSNQGYYSFADEGGI